MRIDPLGGGGKRVTMRRLGDASVVFDASTWQTHLLPPAATVVADVIGELVANGTFSGVAFRIALREDLELDPDSPEIMELLRMLGEIGILPE